MDEFFRTFEEREYGPIFAIVLTSVAIACLEILV